MTATATAPAPEHADNVDLKVVDVPMDDIFHDEGFNTRRQVTPGDVLDLSKNIAGIGLLQPIMIQPWTKNPPFKFRIVLGHRRHMAVKLLDWSTIPAIIRSDLSEIDALRLNFNENINRSQLNILEEAHGVKRFVESGLSTEQIAKMINVGKAWVNIRRNLLTYPTEIQEDAACGYLTQSQIQDLADISDDDEKLKIVKAIKEAKFRGDRRLPDVKKKTTDPLKTKNRSPEETYKMIEHILEETNVSSPFTRALAWRNGEISDLDLYKDMMIYFAEKGISYSPPMEVMHLINFKPIPIPGLKKD